MNVMPGGRIVGAAGDRFFVSGTYVNAGTYDNAGGSLSAKDVINSGQFNQTAGQATVNALSGTGSAIVGGAGTALVSVSSLAQSSVTVNSGGNLVVRSAPQRLTNTVTSLSINGTGNLDLANHELLTSTPGATLKAYLQNGFDVNGNQDWNGHGGITSSVARANPVTYSMGYADGDSTSTQDAGVTYAGGTQLLGAGQRLARVVLTGDANMDGKVDFFDITQLLGYKYNTGQPASYTDGDLNYDGVVDFFDLSLLLSANYNTGEIYLGAATAVSASPALYSQTTVPEPLAVVGLSVTGLLLRRQRRRRSFMVAETRALPHRGCDGRGGKR
jgi:hypothetical protein